MDMPPALQLCGVGDRLFGPAFLAAKTMLFSIAISLLRVSVYLDTTATPFDIKVIKTTCIKAPHGWWNVLPGRVSEQFSPYQTSEHRCCRTAREGSAPSRKDVHMPVSPDRREARDDHRHTRNTGYIYACSPNNPSLTPHTYKKSVFSLP